MFARTDKNHRCRRRHTVMIMDNELQMGGQERKLFDLVARLDDDHFRVVMCCLKKGGYFKDAFLELGVPVYDNLLRHKFDALAYRKLSRIIRAEEVDLLYTFPNPNTLFFGHLARRSNDVRKLLVSFHASRGDDGGRMLTPYMRRLLRRADAMVATAHLHKRYLVEVESLPTEKITVIHNGVDTDRYRPGPPRADLYREFGIDPRETVVATVASLKSEKSIDTLLKAAALASEQARGLRFLIVGDGPDRPMLEKLTNDLGLTNRVIFTGIRDDVPEVLRLADLFVLSSRTEAFPNVVLEAMATGLPVVTTDVGSVWEMVFHGESGYIVPPFDVEAIGAGIVDIVSDSERARAMGAKGRAIVERNFPLRSMCDNRQALFSRLLCDHTAQRGESVREAVA